MRVDEQSSGKTMQQDYDFRSFLLEALAQRQEKNPRYSMRAFARDIGLSPQNLDKVLKAKTGLSSHAAEKIAIQLQLKKSDRELFIALVEAKHHRSKVLRLAAKSRIEKLRADLAFQKITGEEFNLISSWYHMACYMLVDLEDFKPDMGWVSLKLGIAEAQAKAAYDKLFEVGLLREENGRWRRDANKFSVSSEQASQPIQKYHRQLWAKAEKSLMEDDPAVRDFSATLLSISLSDIDFVKSEIDSFHKSLIKKISARPGVAERIYGLSFQFFPVDRGIKK